VGFSYSSKIEKIKIIETKICLVKEKKYKNKFIFKIISE